jgi:sterol 24-C-methyltransferase
MPQASLMSKVQFWSYRTSTVLKAFKMLYTLPQEKVDAFVKSYKIYDHDWVDEEQMIKEMGQDYYNEIKKKLIDWYCVLNNLCAIGQVEKMYIPPAIDLSKSIIENQNLYEERMARDLGLKKGDKALDIGCGRGRVAAHVATYTGAHVTGINIDGDQLAHANQFAKGHGLTKQLEFKFHDMNDLPLPCASNSLDGVYHVQVFSLSKNLELIFKDIHRMLKPGGKVACLDWMRLPNYNPKNPEHLSLMRRIKPLVGAIGTPSVEEYTAAIKKAGLEVLINENASIDGLQAPLIENADKFYTRVNTIINALVKCKILPKHFKAMFDRLTQDGEAFVEADRKRLVTTTHYIVAQKKK